MTEARNVYLFAILRVGKVASVLVNEDETISIKGELPVGASTLVIMDGDQNVSNKKLTELVTVDGKILNAYYSAKDPNDFEYYLNSQLSEFKFRRLSRLDDINVNNNTINDMNERFRLF